MPTQLISCPQKQVIRKYIRNVPCSQKNGRRVTCPEAKKLARQEIPSSKRSQVKYPQVSACVSKQLSKCMPKTCPERERKISTIGCPKCESNRIQKLECEVRYDDFRPSIDRLADFPGFVRSSNSCKERKKKKKSRLRVKSTQPRFFRCSVRIFWIGTKSVNRLDSPLANLDEILPVRRCINCGKRSNTWRTSGKRPRRRSRRRFFEARALSAALSR